MLGRRIALFIDTENASVKVVPALLAKCGKLGTLSIARCYGNAASIKNWNKQIADNLFVPMLTPPSATKANASDFALTIDAVVLLHRNLFDHAIIVSKDKDFIQLQIHIRENGKYVERHIENEESEKIVLAKASPKPSPRPSKANGIEIARILQKYLEIKAIKSVTLQDFGKALVEMLGPDYRRGHGTLTNYIKKTGKLKVEGNQISEL